MGKYCLHANSLIFDRIIIKVSSNQDRHKSSDKFDFGTDQTTHGWRRFELKYLWGQLANLDQIVYVASLVGGGVEGGGCAGVGRLR